MDLNFFPNTLHGDKWKMMFTNIPTLDDISEMRYFDNYVKSCTIPAFSVGEILSNLPDGWQIRHPLGGAKHNQNLGALNISFNVSEDMFNYLTLLSWQKQLRSGKISPSHDDLFRKYTIKRASIILLDNQKRVTTEINFSNLILSELGSLELVFGQSEPVTFSCSFTYEEIVYSIKNPMFGGKVITPPDSNIACGTSGVSNTPELQWIPR